MLVHLLPMFDVSVDARVVRLVAFSDRSTVRATCQRGVFGLGSHSGIVHSVTIQVLRLIEATRPWIH